MPNEKNLTLLTPAVLHSVVLASMREKDRNFHKKYIVHFALLQGLWAVIIFILSLTLVIFPQVALFRETAQKVILNANFSNFSIENGKLNIAIKPSIWTFTISESETSQSVVVVDSTAKMNPYYWDDRIEKGKVKKINGVGFMEEYVLVKKGTGIKKIPYANLSRYGQISMTKGELHQAILTYTNQSFLVKKAVLFLPVVFILGVIFGGLGHIIFMFVTGSVLALFSRNLSNTYTSALKIASALYVGWAYIAVLSLVSYRILYLTLADLSNFFLAIVSITTVALLFLGNLALKQSSNLKSGSKS